MRFAPMAAAAAFVLAVTAAPAHAAPVRSGGGAGIPGSAPLTLTLTLAGPDETALRQYADAVSTPHSTTFGQHLSRQQARDRFGAPQQRVDRVSHWARQSGFGVASRFRRCRCGTRLGRRRCRGVAAVRWRARR